LNFLEHVLTPAALTHLECKEQILAVRMTAVVTHVCTAVATHVCTVFLTHGNYSFFPTNTTGKINTNLLIKVLFFSPTDAQLNSPKNNFKITLKLTLKRSYMFRCKHHLQGAHYSVGEKNKTLIIIKMHGTYVRISKVVLLTRYCAGYKIEKNEMCWACGAYG